MSLLVIVALFVALTWWAPAGTALPPELRQAQPSATAAPEGVH